MLLLPLLAALGLTLWHTFLAVSESIAILEDLQLKPLLDYFNPSREYFRPFFYMTLAGIWRGAGSIAGALAVYKVVHIATVLLVIVLFVWQLRARTALDAAAATLAVAVLVGAPGFRDNLENLPLNQTMIIMLISLLVWALLEHEPRAWSGPAIVVLTVVAVVFKEQGLVLAMLVVSAWWAGAPGATRRVAATVAALALVYVAVRLALMGSWPLFAQAVGDGFTTLSTDEAAEYPRYGLYAYNVASTAANVLFSEPTAGVFRIVQRITQGGVAPWHLNELLSSAAMTGLILHRAIVLWRRRDAQASDTLRVFVAFAVVLAASAALGFNYMRDRFGGVAVVFFALAAFHAIRAAAVAARRGSGLRFATVGIILLALATAWQIRVIGTFQYARESASKIRTEWLVDLPERRTNFAQRSVYLQIMDTLVPQGAAPLPWGSGPNPRWIAHVLGER